MKKLDSEAFDELIYDDEASAVVIFHRENCGICRQTINMLKDIENSYPGIVFAEIDTDQEYDLFSRFGYNGVPQVMFFKGGNLKKTLSGRCSHKDYSQEIANVSA